MSEGKGGTRIEELEKFVFSLLDLCILGFIYLLIAAYGLMISRTGELTPLNILIVFALPGLGIIVVNGLRSNNILQIGVKKVLSTELDSLVAASIGVLLAIIANVHIALVYSGVFSEIARALQLIGAYLVVRAFFIGRLSGAQTTITLTLLVACGYSMVRFTFLVEIPPYQIAVTSLNSLIYLSLLNHLNHVYSE